MPNILFVCHGNICRSPMGKFVLQDLVAKEGMGESFLIDSAATSREELGNDIYPPARRLLTEQGIACEGHRARQITARDYDDYDLILVMDHNNLRNIKYIIPEDSENKIRLLLDFAGRPGQTISDPWYTGNFEQAYQDILAGCQGLLDHYRKEGSLCPPDEK